MKNLLKSLIILGLTLLIIGNSGCCALCKIDTTVVYEVDTIYYPDTIEVEVIKPITVVDSVPFTVIDTFYINHESVRVDTVFFRMDTSIIESNYAISMAWFDAPSIIHYIEDKDSIDVVIDSLIRVIVTNENTIIKTREANKKTKTYRRLTWLFGLILLVILIYALKPFVESLFNRRE